MKVFAMSPATRLRWESEGGCVPVVNARGQLTGFLITDDDLWRAWRTGCGVFSEGIIRVRDGRLDAPRAGTGLTANDVSVFFLRKDGVVQPWITEERGGDPVAALGGAPLLDPDDLDAFIQHARRAEGYARRERSESFEDHYRRATFFWNNLSVREREHLVLCARFELGKLESTGAWQRVVAQFRRVDPELARRVTQGLRHPRSPGAGGAEGLARTR